MEKKNGLQDNSKNSVNKWKSEIFKMKIKHTGYTLLPARLKEGIQRNYSVVRYTYTACEGRHTCLWRKMHICFSTKSMNIEILLSMEREIHLIAYGTKILRTQILESKMYSCLWRGVIPMKRKMY